MEVQLGAMRGDTVRATCGDRFGVTDAIEHYTGQQGPQDSVYDSKCASRVGLSDKYSMSGSPVKLGGTAEVEGSEDS